MGDEGGDNEVQEIAEALSDDERPIDCPNFEDGLTPREYLSSL